MIPNPHSRYMPANSARSIAENPLPHASHMAAIRASGGDTTLSSTIMRAPRCSGGEMSSRMLAEGSSEGMVASGRSLPLGCCSGAVVGAVGAVRGMVSGGLRVVFG